MIQSTIDLAKEYRAEQMLVKMVYEYGTDRFYGELHRCVEAWGRTSQPSRRVEGFLQLALRVVYVLEKRKLQECPQLDGNNNYDGFKMFEIFDRYPEELEEFLGIRNPNLLIIFLAKTTGQGPSTSQTDFGRHQQIQSKIND